MHAVVDNAGKAVFFCWAIYHCISLTQSMGKSTYIYLCRTVNRNTISLENECDWLKSTISAWKPKIQNQKEVRKTNTYLGPLELQYPQRLLWNVCLKLQQLQLFHTIYLLKTCSGAAQCFSSWHCCLTATGFDSQVRGPFHKAGLVIDKIPL